MKATVENRKAHLDELNRRIEKFTTPDEIDSIDKIVEEILELKEKKNVVILGHNYMTPDVFYGVSDFTGDSLALAKKAAETKADIILFDGVHFMAETAKILSPDKKVLIADLEAGCSLAESISGADVRQLKKDNPGAIVVTYINCTAEVKAESDVICTSANAVKIVNSVKSDKVIMIPDEYLAGNVQKETDKKLITWPGKCMVHELYTEEDVKLARKNYPGIVIIAHPECHPDVTKLVDYTGSTSKMSQFVEESKAKDIMLLTECSMSDNLMSDFPGVNFISTCQTCPHMKKITLSKILNSLKEEKFEIDVPEDIRTRAKKALDRMLEFS
ncbi:MAG: quinolinate synthase NadA [Spirochaetia bacterium]|nr:quinolinate synthase NadA [Spirochaetia bacterium]